MTQHTNPSSIKARFAMKFLQSMKALSKKSRSNKYRIRAAAYASMASTVGPRRAWSRALLRKIRNQTLSRFLTNRNRSNCRIRKRSTRRNPREAELRVLVPGGDAMSSCRLLKETAHYVKCLRAQVQVMTSILDQYSS